jgi:hypothetical protein
MVVGWRRRGVADFWHRALLAVSLGTRGLVASGGDGVDACMG